MRLIGGEDTLYIWQISEFSPSRLIVNDTDTFLLVCHNSIQTVDTATNRGSERGVTLLYYPVMNDLILQGMNGERCQLKVEFQQLSHIMDDDLPVDELQSAIFLVGNLFTECFVYRHLNGNF